MIVFSGRRAFQLFNRICKPFVVPEVWDDRDVFGLLKMTARDLHYLEIRCSEAALDYHLRARMVISPHFSYDDNFAPRARFNAEDWQKFETDYPEAAAALTAQKRVTKPNRDDYRSVSVLDFQNFQDEYPVATIVIIQHLVDPSALIGQGIAQEILMNTKCPWMSTPAIWPAPRAPAVSASTIPGPSRKVVPTARIKRRRPQRIAACCTKELGGRLYRCDDCSESFWMFHWNAAPRSREISTSTKPTTALQRRQPHFDPTNTPTQPSRYPLPRRSAPSK